MIKHYVEYLFPNIFVSEHSVEEVAERKVKAVNMPNGCFGFRFFDREVTSTNGETIAGDRENVSGWYYQGEKMTLEQVRATYGMDGNYRKLIENMEINGYDTVVKNKFDQFIHFNDNDTVL